MAYRPVSIDHVNIFVRNAERSLKWYTDVFGFHTQDTMMFPGTNRLRAAFLSCDPGHAHDTAIVIWTRSRPSSGHLPGLSRVTAAWIGQVQTLSRRIGTSSIPHLRHLPALSSRTSSSPAIVQTYETGIFC